MLRAMIPAPVPAPVSAPIPAIDTERLTLRGHGGADFADLAAMWGDPDVTRYIGGRPCTEEESWTRLLRYAGHWTLLGYGYWAIREQGSGRFVGDVGFANLRRALEPGLGDAPEAGWVLASWAHGKGYAGEAVRAVHAWADAQLAATRTVCIIDVDNAASIRVATRNGYREWTHTTYRNEPVILFERQR
jgi:RimJ/RimL family protein N-acetyltransferase